MANWEYKVLSSGKHGMATMAALEQYLNDLGQQQWEIVNWQTAPDNVLHFSGLARRPILRDWKPDEMPAAQAAAKAEKTEDEKERDAWRETIKEELEFFSEKENDADDAEADTEDLLDALRPLMKRSQRGPGAIGAIGFLARKLDQSEEDLIAALGEAGLPLVDDPHATPVAVEHDDEFYWLNKNQRGEVWLNCGPKAPTAKPKPEPKPERTPPPRREEPPAPAAEGVPAESSPVEPAAATEKPAPAPAPAGAPLPEGGPLLSRIRPMMRRNRRGRGWSGSTSYLSRALRTSETELQAVLARMGLATPEDPQAKPVFVEIAGYVYWMNKGQGGQVWINGREKREGETVGSVAAEEASAAAPATAPAAPPADSPAAAPAEAPVAPSVEPAAVASSPVSAPAAEPVEAPVTVASAGDSIFARIRPHFTKNKRSASFSAAPGAVAEALAMSQADLVEALVRAGLSVPATEDEKPTFGEFDGEIFWFNRNAKDELWLNAKAKPARKPKVAGRPAKKKADDSTDEE